MQSTIPLIIALLFTLGSCQNAAVRTGTNKVSVNVAELLSQQSSAPTPAKIVVGRFERAMGDAPTGAGGYENSWNAPQESASSPYSRVDVKVAGQKIDSASLIMSPPTQDAESYKKLRRILGIDFEPEWMSTEAPSVHDSRLPTGYPKMDQSLLKSLGGLNLTNDPKTASIMKEWLIQQATCPIDFVWENLGPTFWPQYIRHGHCKSGHSCSWPVGMSCRQSGSRKLRMLRWVCSNNEDQATRFKRQAFDSAPDSISVQRRRRQGFPDPERRLRRVTRLIRSLSYTKNGYFCQWTPHEQIVSDQCTCSCA